jgi:tetratricopeptide (TPR) repeat protein
MQKTSLIISFILLSLSLLAQQKEYDEAKENINKGNIKEAIKLLDKVIKKDPKFIAAYLDRGTARYQTGDIEGTLNDYNKALEINPRSADAFCNRGIVLSIIGKKREAVEDYKSALKYNPDLVIAYDKLSAYYVEAGHKDSAVALYDDAIARYPLKAYYYLQRGLLKSGKGQLEDFEKSIKCNPEFAEGYYNIGLTYHRNEQLSSALTYYEKALTATETYVWLIGAILNNIGDIKRREGDTEQASLLF